LSLETDLLIDRRRLKRRLLFWRVAAIAALVVAAIVVIHPTGNRDHIARLTIKGEISDTTKEVKAVQEMESDDHAKALILAISSPGGGVYASAALHDALEHLAAKKPVVAVMGSVAASGGFMIAMPAARIFAGPSTVTGSIGVITQLPEFSGLLEKVGITAETLVTGPLKDQPNPAHKLSDAGRVYLKELIGDMFDQFVAIVAKGRHMDEAKVRQLADGRAFTGRQALALGLVDQLGDESDARAWLETQPGIAKRLPIQELRTTTLKQQLMEESLAPVLVDALKSVLFQGVVLDGPQALWQPSAVQ
jgi:protease-4